MNPYDPSTIPHPHPHPITQITTIEIDEGPREPAFGKKKFPGAIRYFWSVLRGTSDQYDRTTFSIRRGTNAFCGTLIFGSLCDWYGTSLKPTAFPIIRPRWPNYAIIAPPVRFFGWTLLALCMFNVKVYPPRNRWFKRVVVYDNEITTPDQVYTTVAAPVFTDEWGYRR